jgi:hypothetical protein
MKNFFVTLFLLGVSLFAQVPTPQPQPSSATYPVSALDLLPTYDRAGYLAKTGTQAPPFDVTRPAKSWFDSTASGTMTYSVFNGSPSAPAMSVLTLPAAQASSVNLPGLPTYAAYTPHASNVVIAQGTCQGQTSGYSGIYQSTFDEAMALMNEIGDSSLVINTGIGPMFSGSPFNFCKIDNSNPVSIYKLNDQNVGLMLQQRNSKGVGYPGTWSKAGNASGNYVFTPATLNDGSTSTLGSVPVPERALLPNEKLVSVINGIIPTAEIQRTDLTPAPTTGGGFTDADRDMMKQILGIAQALQKVFGQ